MSDNTCQHAHLSCTFRDRVAFRLRSRAISSVGTETVMGFRTDRRHSGSASFLPIHPLPAPILLDDRVHSLTNFKGRQIAVTGGRLVKPYRKTRSVAHQAAHGAIRLGEHKLNNSSPSPPPPLRSLAGNYTSFSVEKKPLNQYIFSLSQGRFFQSATYYKIRC